MRILAIDTSCRAASVAVIDGRDILARFWLSHGRTHAEEIMPCIEAALRGLRMTPRDLEAIAAVTGPGSFTGLRVGVSCAKGMAYALGIPTVAVPALESLAYALSPYLVCAGEDAYACPLTDARNRNVYCAIYRPYKPCEQSDLDRPRAVLSNAILDANARGIEELGDKMAQLAASAAASGSAAVFAINGDGAAKYCDELSSMANPGRVILARESDLLPDAAHAAALASIMARRGEFTPPESLAPSYLRKTQAERLREQRAAEASVTTAPPAAVAAVDLKVGRLSGAKEGVAEGAAEGVEEGAAEGVEEGAAEGAR